MMLVKAARGDGSWEMFEAPSGLSYLGTHNLIAVPDGDHDFFEDERFPHAERIHVLTQDAIVLGDSTSKQDTILVRWVRWENQDSEPWSELLVSAHPVYVCNERGDTVEALR